MAGDGSEQPGDFVEQLSAPLPLNVLAELLGVPRAMWPTMFRWTNQIAGATDPEYQVDGEGPVADRRRARASSSSSTSREMAAERRKQPARRHRRA